MLENNPVLDAIRSRRSIRKYTGEPIAEPVRRAILEAGFYAPSAMNRQTWRLTGIIDPEKVQKLAAAVKKALGAPQSEDYSFYHAPAFIIASNTRGYANGMADCACAMENMMLAAHSMGLGTVWINQLKDTCGDAGVRKLLTAFGVPEDHDVYACCAIGTALGGAKAPDRKAGATAIVE